MVDEETKVSVGERIAVGVTSRKINEHLGVVRRDDLGALLRLLTSDVDRTHHASVEHMLVKGAQKHPTIPMKLYRFLPFAVSLSGNCISRHYCALREQ